MAGPAGRVTMEELSHRTTDSGSSVTSVVRSARSKGAAAPTLLARKSTFAVRRRARLSSLGDAALIAARASLNLVRTPVSTMPQASEWKMGAAMQAATMRDQGGSSQAIDALEGQSVISALVLGFAVSSQVAVACEARDEMHRPTVASFCVIMAIATALSGYATVFFGCEIYYLKRLADEAGESRSIMVETFMTFTGRWRKVARISSNLALASEMIGLAVLLWDFLPHAFAWTLAATLGAGAVMVILTMLHLSSITHWCLEELDGHEAVLAARASLDRAVTMEEPLQRGSVLRPLQEQESASTAELPEAYAKEAKVPTRLSKTRDGMRAGCKVRRGIDYGPRRVSLASSVTPQVHPLPLTTISTSTE